MTNNHREDYGNCSVHLKFPYNRYAAHNTFLELNTYMHVFFNTNMRYKIENINYLHFSVNYKIVGLFKRRVSPTVSNMNFYL